MLKSKSVSGPWAHLYSQFHVHTIWKAVEQGFPYWRMSSSPFRAWDASEGVEGVSKHLFSLPVVLYLACLLRTTKDGQKATLLQLNPEDPALLNRHWFLQAVNLLTCAKISPCFSETPNDPGNQRGKEATFNNTFPLQATENQKEILEARQNCHILFGAHFQDFWGNMQANFYIPYTAVGVQGCIQQRITQIRYLQVFADLGPLFVTIISAYLTACFVISQFQTPLKGKISVFRVNIPHCKFLHQ